MGECTSAGCGAGCGAARVEGRAFCAGCERKLDEHAAFLREDRGPEGPAVVEVELQAQSRRRRG